MDPGEQLVGRGVERLAAGHDVGAELGEEALEALAGGDRERRRPAACEAGVPLGDLLAHVGDVEVGHLAGALEEATAASGSSVWTWTFSVASSPTTRTESPSASSRGRNSRAVEARPETMKLVQ